MIAIDPDPTATPAASDVLNHNPLRGGHGVVDCGVDAWPWMSQQMRWANSESDDSPRCARTQRGEFWTRLPCRPSRATAQSVGRSRRVPQEGDTRFASLRRKISQKVLKKWQPRRLGIPWQRRNSSQTQTQPFKIPIDVNPRGRATGGRIVDRCLARLGMGSAHSSGCTRRQRFLTALGPRETSDRPAIGSANCSATSFQEGARLPAMIRRTFGSSTSDHC
jgi:hypothetical protein